MRTTIEKLEKQLQDTVGLTILEKHDDGFAFAIAFQKNGKTHVVLTTKGIYHIRKESCLIYMNVSRHIPFNSVTPTVNGDFTLPYTLAVRNQKTCIGKHIYGLTVDELPIFQ